MSEARSLLLSHVETVTLPSGLKAKIRKPRIADCIVAGAVPLPVMTEVERKSIAGTADTLTAEEIEVAYAYNRAMVRLALVEVEGETVTLDDEDLDVMDADDFEEILAIATRAKDAEGKA
jgi:hypothetical protein